MKISCTAILLLFFGLLYAQENITPEEIKGNNKPWTSLDANNDNFQFVVVTDRTGGHRPGIFPKGVNKINLLQPEFVMSVGDLIEGYTEDIEQLNKEWAEFEGFIDRFEMPFFYVAGNHDYTNQVMAKMWEEKFGAEYYHFLYRNVLFLCLNSEDGATRLRNPDIGAEQLAYIEQTLDKYPDVRWTMVFMHQPLWVRENAKNWLKVEKLLENRKHSVFTGHYHRYTLYKRNRSDYFTLATMGGGSGLRGPRLGEFDHFMWVTMTPDGPYYANVLLDGVYGKDVYTEEQLAKSKKYDAIVPIKQLPMLVENGTLKEIQYEVTNPDDAERDIKLSLSNAGFLNLESNIVETTIAPKSTRIVSLPVSIDGTLPAKVRPVRTRTEFMGEDFVWVRNYYAAPVAHQTIPTTGAKIKLDGKIKDWKKVSQAITGTIAAEDEDDAQVDFSITTTTDHLYIKAVVQDNEIISGFGLNPFEYDALSVLIDGRPMKLSAYNTRNTESLMKGEWMALIAQPGKETFELGFKEMTPAAAKAMGRKTEEGYQVEYAVPFSLLDEQFGGSWENLRINITLIDVDGDSKEAKVRSWLPDWQGNNVGSGTFFRK